MLTNKFFNELEDEEVFELFWDETNDNEFLQYFIID